MLVAVVVGTQASAILPRLGASRSAAGTLPLLCCVVLLFVPTAALAGGDADERQNAELKSLYDSHQWFRLRDAVRASNAPALYRGAVAAAFNDVERAEKHLHAVIDTAPGSPQASDAHGLLTYVYQRAGRYRRALSEVEAALAVTPDNAGLKNARALFSALSRYPEQFVAERRSSRTRCTVKDGNLFVPVTIDVKSLTLDRESGSYTHLTLPSTPYV